MTSFEKFHPVLTAYYTLDWLTQTPVKQVDALFNQPVISTTKADHLPTQILDTVKSINRVMQKVMNGAELTWGITNSDSQQFIGIITISGFETTDQVGNIDFIIDQSAINSSKEVIERTVKFASDHFNFSSLQIELAQKDDQMIQILAGLGFSRASSLTFTTQL
ncbi:hypothetical protein FD12_GL001097 [Lentilactobacillus rapi DSM 19907 = JCM 15042]|uniref:GNAT family acetyltransferase n=2 Tax=Lentilactobacillus rapi TaxID=481723 RepID=A0A512PN68_9LACO|nr:GNAT family N-acetyltransferase [Lentilactobacillus rapi]KRL18007.1 hypothetical protein FD12_GL001097 [Lentilactobacillus rapi DSM 19907 = JCM 15042]GEP72647.1 GNAT family acetyltransferase [Lentilactobacillus rapi]